MKVVAFNGSARSNGNTASMIRTVFTQLESEGIETELVQLAGEKIRGCTACNGCRKNKDKRCTVTDDIIDDISVNIGNRCQIYMNSYSA